MAKKMSFMDLPVVHEKKMGSMHIVEGVTHWHEAGKTRSEEWGLCIFQSPVDGVMRYYPYRYLRGTSYHYGG